MGDKAVALARVAVGKVSGDQPGSATKRDPSCSSNCASSDTGKVDGGDGHDQSGGAGAGGIHKESRAATRAANSGANSKFACYEPVYVGRLHNGTRLGRCDSIPRETSPLYVSLLQSHSHTCTHTVNGVHVHAHVHVMHMCI